MRKYFAHLKRVGKYFLLRFSFAWQRHKSRVTCRQLICDGVLRNDPLPLYFPPAVFPMVRPFYFS